MKKQPHNVERVPKEQPERKPYGGSYGASSPNYKKPMSPTQIAWRVGLFILGAIVGAVISNL